MYALPRGNPEARLLCLGEAPGKREGVEHRTFCGPAGQLLDKILAVGKWNTATDWLLVNPISCRPAAPEGSGKENLVPTAEQITACEPFLRFFLTVSDPAIVVLVGKVATTTMFPQYKDSPMKDLVGKLLYHTEYTGPAFFPIYHPSALLRAGKGTERYEGLRATTIEHVKTLRELADELGVG